MATVPGPEHEDDDLRTQRASAYALAGILKYIGLLASLSSRGENATSISHSYARDQRKYAARIVDLLDYLQEDPQLLDPHLKVILPPILRDFTHIFTLSQEIHQAIGPLRALSDVIYSLCKVRGEKVIVQFFNNEARYVQPLLELFARIVLHEQEIAGANATPASSQDSGDRLWKLRYVLLLWIGHLMLTPFDLRSISSDEIPPDLEGSQLRLPVGLPAVSQQVIYLCSARLSAPTKEHSSATTALVKLAVRPDMQKAGVLSALLEWAVEVLSAQTSPQPNIHVCNGTLLLLNGIVRSTGVDTIMQHLPLLFKTVGSIFQSEDHDWPELKGSAVSKKLSIKVQRNVVLQLLNVNEKSGDTAKSISHQMLEQQGALEDTIDFFLSSLGDRDTQVRYAAAKGLSAIAAKMPNGMAGEVVEAVLDLLRNNVQEIDNYGEKLADVSTVSATQWHGLTLTLAHMLFRRIPSPTQLKDVLNALYASLTFEQRSTFGTSHGVNVRDAANFGLWSLARRYKTSELMSLQIGGSNDMLENTIQKTATRLLAAACLDPSGNVRRGSSAALQELIGRHPDVVAQGIAVVQAVHYQAVGLRQRAMIDIALSTSYLSSLYLLALWEGLLDWRGVQASDKEFRRVSASALGQLSTLMSPRDLSKQLGRIKLLLENVPRRESEWRHGLTLALSSILAQQRLSVTSKAKNSNPQDGDMTAKDSLASQQYWSMFEKTLFFSPKEASVASMRPDITAYSLVHLISSICMLSGIAPGNAPTDTALQTLATCLKTADEATMVIIPKTCHRIGCIVDETMRDQLVKQWTSDLLSTLKSPRRAGLMLGLAGLASSIIVRPSELSLLGAVVDTLVDVYETCDVEARVIAIRALVLIYYVSSDAATQWSSGKIESLPPRMQQTILAGLNDYTINQRGDVGSLVRIEAILGFSRLAVAGITREHWNKEVFQECQLAIERLSLERLDKVRYAASQYLLQNKGSRSAGESDESSGVEVSSFEYFVDRTLNVLQGNLYDPGLGEPSAGISPPSSRPAPSQILEAFLIGISSSACLASGSLTQPSRSAISAVLSLLPVLSVSSSTSSTSSVESPRAASPIRDFPSVQDVISALMALLSKSIAAHDDRVLVPLLETTCYLVDAGLFSRLYNTQAQPEPPEKYQSGTQGANQDIERDNKQEKDGNFENEEERAEESRKAAHKSKQHLLSLIQKAHFRSTLLPKLLACLDLYRGLALLLGPLSLRRLNRDNTITEDATRSSNGAGQDEDKDERLKVLIVKKLCNILRHPFPKVRIGAAETLHVILGVSVSKENQMKYKLHSPHSESDTLSVETSSPHSYTFQDTRAKNGGGGEKGKGMSIVMRIKITLEQIDWGSSEAGGQEETQRKQATREIESLLSFL